jgi:hypothetical protein
MARTLMKDLDDGYTEKNFFTESEQNEIVEKIYNEHYQKYKINFHNFNEFADCNKLLEKIYHSSNLFVNCVVYLPHTMSLYYFGSAKMYSECCKIMATLASSKLGVLAVDKIFKALEYVISNKYKFLKPNIENRIHNSMDKGLVTDLKEAFDSISAIILPVIKGIGYATDAGSEMLNKALNKTKNTLNHTFNAASECVANNGLAGFVSNIHSDEESKTMRNICKDVKSIANIASYPIRQVTSFINR